MASVQVKTVNIIKSPVKDQSSVGAEQKVQVGGQKAAPPLQSPTAQPVAQKATPTSGQAAMGAQQPATGQPAVATKPAKSDGKIQSRFIGGVTDIDDLFGSNKDFLKTARTRSQERGEERSPAGQQRSGRSGQVPLDLPKAQQQRYGQQSLANEPMSPEVPCVTLEKKDYMRKRVWHELQRCLQPNVDIFLDLPALPDPMLGSGQTYYDIFGFPSKAQYCKKHGKVRGDETQ